MTHVYVIAAEGGPVKVGIAANPAARLAQLRTGSPYALRLVHVEEAGADHARQAERLAHAMLGAFRLNGEWFQLPAEDAIAAVRTAVDRVRNPVLPPEFQRLVDAAQRSAG